MRRDVHLDASTTARSPSSRSTTRRQRALGRRCSRSSRPRSTASTRTTASRAIVLDGRRRARVRRGRGHQGVPGAARVGRGAQDRRLGARDPEARASDGRSAQAVRRGDPGLLPRRRARARDVLRHPRLRRRRAARAAGDQARADPRRRRHAAAPAARRRRAGDAAEPHRRLHRRARPRTSGVSSSGSCRATSCCETALGIARAIAARSPVAVAVLRELARTTRDLPLEEGLRREAEGFRRCLASEDGPRASPRSSRSASPSSPGASAQPAVPARATRRAGAARRPRRCPSRAGRGQAIVDVRAAGINFADVLDPPRAATRRCPSCRPCSAPRSRARSTARESWASCAPKAAGTPSALPSTVAGSSTLPAAASFAEGAAFPMAFLTAWIPLTELVRIGFGSRVLVTAAAGAVGTAALQLVRSLNGAPVAAVGSEEKLELTRSLGADEGVTYDALGELEPVDAVFDLVGGDVFKQRARAPEAARLGGRRRLCGRTLGGREPGVARGPQHRRPGLLPRPAHGPPTRISSSGRWATSCVSGKVAPCGRSSDMSSRSSRRATRTE